MAGLLPGDPSHHGVDEAGIYKGSQDKPEDAGGIWYFSRKEIEENSPSRQDGIDLKKETYLQKSYCTLLQDLGMRLKVPQVTIATAIIFCHRFFLRQSHARNDRRTIATVCMFLAGKVEETPRPLKDVILVSYEIIRKKDSAAVQRIKQKEVYEQQKELILLGERVVLATLGFDLNVHHPYKPLVEAIKKFKVAQNALAQVAWNFVNDGLRTSLCLQFKPHHIAAGAIFLAAKFLKVKLPSDGEKVWWQEFDVTPRQLEEVSNQMLELYEQNRVPPSQASGADGSAGGIQRPSTKASGASEENIVNSGHLLGGGATLKAGSSKSASSRLNADQSLADNHVGPVRGAQNRSNDYGNSEAPNIPEPEGDGEINDNQHRHRDPLPGGNAGEEQNALRFGSEGHSDEDQERSEGRVETSEGELDTYHGQILEHKDGAVGQSPQRGITLDKNKLKAALEKRRKSRPDVSRKNDVMDEDDFIERELEDGIELASENEKSKPETESKTTSRLEHNSPNQIKHQDEAGDGHYSLMKGLSSRGEDYDNVQEGELESLDNADQGYQSPKVSSRKRKVGSPADKPAAGKQWHDYMGSQNYGVHDFPENRNRLGRFGYPQRDNKRHVQENHV
ncbi:hypothetical protein ACH5RR_029444 [Cinchona calisaya]|uniref:Cyclin-like domain-containing protein n=1 Tax=Cinchona calisaya TaxID=153742 RepID=A0ABD2YRS1_9GENT